MNFLADALKKYYTKQSGKIIFANNLTLNNFAFQMWEQLDYSQVDASVLSKVINGKRLFTPKQLEVFCELLQIYDEEKNYLFFCLNRDECGRNNIDIDNFYISKSYVLETVQKFTKELFVAQQTSEHHSSLKINTILDTFTKDLTGTPLSLPHQRILNNIMGANLFMKAKQFINYKHGSVYLIENENLTRVYTSSPILNKVFPRKTGKTMGAYINQEPYITPVEYITGIHPELKELNIGSDLVVPLIFKNKTFGVLSFLSQPEVRFNNKDLVTIEHFLQQSIN